MGQVRNSGHKVGEVVRSQSLSGKTYGHYVVTGHSRTGMYANTRDATPEEVSEARANGTLKTRTEG